MTSRSTPTTPTTSTASTAAGRGGPRAQAAGVAFAFLVVMLGATLPTPLYPLYEADLGFGQATVTLVFAAYAVGVLAALLLLGRASDALGRRRLLLVAVAVSALSTLLFVTTPDLSGLYLGRVLSGLSAGIATTTGTVYLVELAPEGGQARASLLATVVNMTGLGLGPPLAGLVSELAPAPLVTAYVVHLGLLALAVPALLLAREVVVAPGASLRPERPSVAAEARAVFVPASLAAFAAFAALGLVTGATAGILGQVLGVSDRAAVGFVVLTLFAASALAQVGLRGVATRTALTSGCLVLVLGAGVLAAALLAESVAVLVAALAVIGVGQALAFRAGTAAITAAAPAAERARTVTSFFLVAYLAISLPVVLLGAASLRWGLRDATLGFAGGVALIALASFVAQLVVERRSTSGPRG